MNIYDECVDNSKVIYQENKDRTFFDTLDRYKKLYENKGYKVIFIDLSACISYGARIVLYRKDQNIPLGIQDYKHKWVNHNGKWIREGLLGICDKCGNYDELVSLSNEGNLCSECTKIEF
jgi:hypothetical protein